MSQGSETSGKVSVVVSCDFVKLALDQNGTVFIADCCFDDSSKEYGYLPNARTLKINRIIDPNTKIVSTEKFAAYVKEIGLNEDDHIICYDSAEGQFGAINSTFMWYVFTLFGHKSICVMDGGRKEWIAKGYPIVDQSMTVMKPGTFKIKYTNFKTITFDQFMNEKSNAVVVDVRFPSHYSGEGTHPKAAYKGRIDGTISVPGTEILDEKKMFKPISEIGTYLEQHGLNKSNDVIVHCNTGRQASSVLMVMIELGYKIKIFTGGWVEYSHAIKDEKL